MRKNLILSLLSVLWLVPFPEWLRAEEPRLTPELEVQAHGKADSRLLVEIPDLVATWTDRCTEAEAVGANAAACWRDAAAAADEYASGYEGPLIEELQLLESSWLQRAAQLQSSQSNPVKEKPPSAASVSGTPPVKKALRPQQPHRAGKFVAAQKVKVVPTAFVSQNSRRDKVLPGKGVSLAPGAAAVHRQHRQRRRPRYGPYASSCRR